MIENINWYPGHMKKTRELIKENLKMVDTVVEIVDARIPVSSRNPIIDEIVQGKHRVLLLNKSDLADDQACERWIEKFREDGSPALKVNCMTGAGIDKVFKLLEKRRAERDKEAQRKKPYRIMIVGVPNVGKSSLINRMTGKKSTQVGNKPGVTKGKQWLTLKNGMQLLDTPGILWPKFEDPEVGLNLAFCGSIKDEILDRESLALELVKLLQEKYPEELMSRYKLDEIMEMPLDNMDAIAMKRGFIKPGKKIDYERTAKTLLDEFRSGAIGRITLE